MTSILNVKSCQTPSAGFITSLTFDFIFQYVVSLDQGKFASLTIKGVSMENSGRYTMIVQNKYGGESVDIVVSVTAVYHKWLDLLWAVEFFRPSVAQILFHWGHKGDAFVIAVTELIFNVVLFDPDVTVVLWKKNITKYRFKCYSMFACMKCVALLRK